MKQGQFFEAIDPLQRKFLYRYIGEQNTTNGYNIKLLNITMNTEIFVENEWFNQRIIRKAK